MIDPCTYGCKQDRSKVKKARKKTQKVVFGSDAYNTKGIKEMADRWTKN